MEQNNDLEKKPLSFGFTKRQETKQLGLSAVSEHPEKVDDSKDFVLSLEENEVKSTKPVQSSKSKEYIIPLITQNRWRLNDVEERTQANNQGSLDLIAAKEILQDSARLNDDWEERETVDTSRSIPLLMQNKVPDGFETENSLNVDLRPEEPKDADYDQIPIEQFGLALLRGMGWKEGSGIGKNAKMIAPVEAQLRPKGLGLGADKNNVQGNEKNSNLQKSNESDENFEFKSGAHCVVLNGPNKDMYGTVEGIDEDNARAMVNLSLSGKVVNLMQCSLRLVSKKDFEKHSKYLNKAKVDKYKDEEVKRSRKEVIHNGTDYGERIDNTDYNDKIVRRKRDDSGFHKDSTEDRHYNKEARKRSKLSSDIDSDEKHKKHKHHHKKHHKKSKSSHKSSLPDYSYSSSEDLDSTNEIQYPWVQKDLRVRIIDKNLKKGKYYKEKVIVEDVPSPDFCVCKTADGKVIENVSPSSLETVVPRTDNAVVVIVRGSNRGQLGSIMKRDKERCLALIQLLTDRDIVLKLQYDEICEYVGDVHFVE